MSLVNNFETNQLKNELLKKKMEQQSVCNLHNYTRYNSTNHFSLLFTFMLRSEGRKNRI